MTRTPSTSVFADKRVGDPGSDRRRHERAIRKLVEEHVATGYRKLEPFRRKRREMLDLYTGNHYPNCGAPSQPIPVFHRAITTIMSRLAGFNADAQITPETEARHEAWARMLSHRMTRMLRECHFREEKEWALINAMCGFGVYFVDIGPTGNVYDFADEHLDPGEPFVRCISPDDFGLSATSTRWREAAVKFHRYSVSQWYLLEHDLLTLDELAMVPKTVDRDREDAKEASTGGLSFRHLDPDEREIDLIDMWVAPGVLAREAMTITIPGDRSNPAGVLCEDKEIRSMVLRDREYVGAKGGPYVLLSFNPVPDNTFGTPPMGFVMVLARMVNMLARQVLDAELEYKKAAATNNERDAKVLAQLRNGEIANLESPDELQKIEVGGASDHSHATLAWAVNTFNREAGNVDLMSGAGSAAGEDATATYVAEVQNSLNIVIDALERRAGAADDEVLAKMAWFEHSNPVVDDRIPFELAGVRITLPMTPEVRADADYFDFNFNVRLGSMRAMSPEQHARKVLEFVANIALPAMAAEAQSGGRINATNVMKLASRGLLPPAEIEQLINDPVVSGLNQMLAAGFMPTMQHAEQMMATGIGGGIGGGRNSEGTGFGMPGTPGFKGGMNTGASSPAFDRQANTERTMGAM